MVSDSDFNRSFDSFYDLVKEGILDISNQGPATQYFDKDSTSESMDDFRSHKSWKRKIYLWKLYKASSSVAHHERIKGYRSIFDSLCRKAKSQYYHRKFSDCGKDIRKTWYLINSVLRSTPPLPSVPSMLILDGKTVQGDADVQLELTFYFANIGKATASSASSATSCCDFRAFLGPSCLKSTVLEFCF